MTGTAAISWLPGRRVRVPTILQQEAAECGAACLAMVLAAHGRWISLAAAREQCGVSRDGVKASNILRAARNAGMMAKGLRVETEGLTGIACPFIAFWSFNHFVVVERYQPKSARVRAWINDPASGPRTVGVAEFEEAFTGVVLTFEPHSDFAPEGRRDRFATLIGDRMKGFEHGFTIAFLAGVLLVVPGIVAAGAVRVFIDRVLLAGTTSWLPVLAGGLVVLALFRALITYLQQSALARTQAGLSIAASTVQMWRLLHLALGFFSQRFAGDIANRFTLVDQLAGVLTGGLAPAAIALVAIGAFGGALFGLDPVLGAIASISALLALGALVLIARASADSGRRLVKDDARLQAATVQCVSMASELKAHGMERPWLARWMGYHAKLIDAEQRSRKITIGLSQFSALIMTLAGTAVLVAGGWRVMDGTISVGILLAFQTIMGSFATPVLSLVGVGGQFQQVRGIAERLDDIATYRTLLDGTRDVSAVVEVGLEVQSVGFAYGPFEPPVIQDFSLDIKPGERIALVGVTGSGKSTAGRLIAGLIEPTQGTITLGGIPLASWPRARLRTMIAYLDQDASLFEGTVRDNIALWDDSISEKSIARAAHDARAHGFITARERGYDFRITETGANLSGGERQRIALSRALTGNPLLLVLDEATSALEPAVEKEVMDAVRRRGSACIMIAHRLASVRDCDSILVMENGRVIERGTHRELTSRNGAYARLVEL
jgi:NHLM bacteriocin system ABC transporter peptidase/ATP-binding protein